MKFLALVVFAIAFVAVSAKPGLLGGWWGGHGAVDPGAVVIGPAGSISVGPSSGGAVIPGAGWHGHGVWGLGAWGPGLWGHHGLGW
ncbi:hypothetical protein CBL_02035 [Carabus blaptoides fortunei]